MISAKIDPAKLSPQDPPVHFFGVNAATGACEQLTGDAAKEARSRYPDEIERYEKAVSRIRQIGNGGLDETNTLFPLVYNAQLQHETRLIERQIKRLERIMSVRQRWIDMRNEAVNDVRDGMTNDQKQAGETLVGELEEWSQLEEAYDDESGARLLRMSELEELNRSTQKLLDMATHARITRKALDQTVAELQNKKLRYRKLDQKYQSETIGFENTALQTTEVGEPKLDGGDGKGLKLLVDTVDLHGRNVPIPSFLWK